LQFAKNRTCLALRLPRPGTVSDLAGDERLALSIDIAAARCAPTSAWKHMHARAAEGSTGQHTPPSDPFEALERMSENVPQSEKPKR